MRNGQWQFFRADQGSSACYQAKLMPDGSFEFSRLPFQHEPELKLFTCRAQVPQVERLLAWMVANDSRVQLYLKTVPDGQPCQVDWIVRDAVMSCLTASPSYTE